MMKVLDKLYDAYMDNDSLNLLHEEFDYMIEDLRGQGQIKDLLYVREEKDNLKMMREISYITTAPFMEKRVIFQRTLSREILSNSLGRSELPLMITARSIAISGYFLQNC